MYHIIEHNITTLCYKNVYPTWTQCIEGLAITLAYLTHAHYIMIRHWAIMGKKD